MTTIQHALAPEDLAPAAKLRELAAPGKGKLSLASRATFDDMFSRRQPAPGVTFEEARVGGIPGWWCRPPAPIPRAAILFLHGGWFALGSAQAFRHAVSHYAARVGAAAFIADYRLAPEHPFPAGFDDACAAYAGLAAGGATAIALVGESAGGALSLAVLAHAVAAGGVRPRCAAVVSPVTDLTMTGDSMVSRADADPIFTKASGEALVRLYLGDHDARDPRASPLYGALTGLPPVRIDVGDDELLLSDALRYGDASANAEVHVWDGMPHVFTSQLGVLQAADRALTELTAFVRKHL